MIFKETDLPGAFLIELEPIQDDRGSFARTWCAREFAEHGLSTAVAQCNSVFNHRKWTLRGMHYQAAPAEEAKTVRCTRGAVYDVIIDLRPGSPTHKKWISVELTEGNRKMLYVPEGFAHGYQTLQPDTETAYVMSAFYMPEADRGVRWDDAAFAIEWPNVEDLVISKKDQSWPDFII